MSSFLYNFKHFAVIGVNFPNKVEQKSKKRKLWTYAYMHGENRKRSENSGEIRKYFKYFFKKNAIFILITLKL